MANRQNLKNFKKGYDERRNTNGRPRVLPELKEILTEILSEEKTNEKGQKMSGLEAVLKALHSKATKGDVRAIQEILDRYYGKVKTTVDVTTDGQPIKPPKIVFKDYGNE